AELGMAMLFITHNLGIVKRIADRTLIMTQGEVVERGSTGEVFAAPRHSYTRHLLSAQPKGTPPQRRPDAPTVVEARDRGVWSQVEWWLLRRVVGQRKGVDGVDVAVREGETLGIVWKSGSRKFTLGIALLRLSESEGGIVYLGRQLQGLSCRAM